MPSFNGVFIKGRLYLWLKAKKVNRELAASMKSIVYNLVIMLNFADLSPEDVNKYIQPYDIFDDEEFEELMNLHGNGEGIQKVASSKAKVFKFGYCNFPNEIMVENAKTIQKTGTRQGIVVLSENEIKNSVVVKFRIIREGRLGMGCIGFGICDKSCLNFCPFLPTRNFGPFVAYYTFKKDGRLNMAELGDRYISKDYDRGFGQGDCVNIVIDVENSSIAFGINDVMFPEKTYNTKRIENLHLAIWLNDENDEVQLIYEN